MSDLHVGKVVDGRYRLNRVMGQGASGAVYAATQLAVDRPVAVKLLHAPNSSRFEAEAKAIARLNHTNVITLHDFGYDEDLGAHFMVTEFADGVPLSERMREVMSTELILQIALEIASAMHHAHAKGIVHRDLKPENVILTRADGRVDVAKVLDFGLARLVEEGAVDEPAEHVDAPPAAAAVSLHDLAGSSDSDEEIPSAVSPVLSGEEEEEHVADTTVLRNLDVSEDIGFGEEE